MSNSRRMQGALPQLLMVLHTISIDVNIYRERGIYSLKALYGESHL